jgi:hypothetical protein
MRHVLFAAATALVLSLSAVRPALSQVTPEEQTIKEFFSGQQMLVTYREGGSLYGTFFTLQVHFCRSGRYMTFGESRKHTVLDNEQVNTFSDEGTWEITTVRGQMVLKYVSVSGQPNTVPVRVLNGRVSLGDGISVVRRGVAQCQR